MRPQIFFWKGEFHAETKPLIHPEAVPADVKIITLQKHFEEHRGMDSVLLRIEHLYQPRDKMGSPQNIQLDHLLNGFMVHESHLFMAGGDVPIDAFKRLTCFQKTQYVRMISCSRVKNLFRFLKFQIELCTALSGNGKVAMPGFMANIKPVKEKLKDQE